MKKLRTIFLGTFAVLMFSTMSYAATSVSWTSPPNGSSYPVGTIVNPTGIASSRGTVGGGGLDLALVLDSSGSMRRDAPGTGKSRQQVQKLAAIALVNALPFNTTSVTVIEFDSNANYSQGRVLTALNPNIAQVIAAINAVDASGDTNIPSGIALATTELTSVRHTAGRDQMMVVMSDGVTVGDSHAAAQAAIAAGVDAVHSVGISSAHSASTMRSIVSGDNGIYGDGDDIGVYTDATDMTTLVGIFDGTGGSLVGLDHVEITLPDGTVLDSSAGDFVVSGVGTFQVPAPYWAMMAGNNLFTATAFGEDGTSASADLTLIGTTNGHGVPEPATLGFLCTALVGMIGFKKRKESDEV